MYTLRFRAYASPDVLRELKSQLRLLCEAYNTLRYTDIAFHERDGKWLNKTELRQLALDLRKQDPDYQRVFSQVFQNVADRYCEARDRFFQGLARFPREKKPERYRSLVYPQSGWKILSTRPARSGRKSWIYLSLSCLGVFKVLAHRPLPDKISRVAVKVTPTNKLFVSFLVEGDLHVESERTGKVAALDLGISHLLVTSDGHYVDNPRFLERVLSRYRSLSRLLSRKRKGSSNWEKARLRLAKLLERVINTKIDFYYKLANTLVRRYDVLVMEDLNVVKMTRDGSRTLNRHLHDVSFSRLSSTLKWVFQKHGKEVLEVNPAYSSQTCSKCGRRHNLSLSDRVITCQCGLVLDRDLNASLNLLRRAGWEPPVEPVEMRPLWQASSMKQEAPPFRAG
ncbi:RNA-guided endonuclease InsQ/TnpB family protein [Metallosphaera javensis (ex Sakai et al. 2022)]|uniref:RNA-guided endonuclease InsQ/TnpB family protein n=1 Tax=Metallosphaera javensis (ex Sakai et al. 2022) TaxID=2775498 RepID=UPI00258616B9|nr:MAG: transposase [Metallosphaera javensis (ex Sakai et al. 2022)]